MKRPRSRSFGSDPDDDSSGEITAPKASWSRRDADLDHASSHRRFRSSSSTSSAKPYDERSASSLSSRKRFDHEADQFDRRSRYWDGDRAASSKVSSSSPRSGYGADRMWRSESFSRREFPKGFRSERDRSRRECGGGGWRRSADEVPTVGRSRVGSEDRGRSRSKGGSPGMSSDVRKASGVRKETAGGGSGNGCGNEMEEGELVPEPTMEHKAKAAPIIVTGIRKEETDVCLESRLKSLDENKSIKEKEDDSDGKDSELGSSRDLRPLEVLGQSSSEVVRPTVGEEETAVSGGREENTATKEEQQPCLPSSSKEVECVDQEEQQLCSLSPESKQLVEHNDVGTSIPKSPYLEANAEAAVDKEMDTGNALLEEVEKSAISNAVGLKQKEEGNADVEVEHKHPIDLEAEPLETACAVHSASNESSFVDGNKSLTLELMMRPLEENDKDKGKRLMISLSNEAHSMDEDDDSEGPSSRGFELVFRSAISRQDKAGTSGIVIGKNENDGHKLESLDLSLGLPGAASAHPFEGTSQKTKPLFQAVSAPSLHSSFHTLSDGFTASMSGSQTFVHNPSCSLTQNSVENYEHSVGSRPLFQGIDQDSDGTVWRGQPSNGVKQDGLVVPLYQRMLSNNNTANQSRNTVNANSYSNSNGMSHQSNFPRHTSSNNIYVSPAASLECNMEKKMLTREKSSGSLFKNEQQNVGKFSFGNVDGVCGVDTVLLKIVSEPVQLIGRAFDDITEPSVSYLKKTLVDTFANKDRQVDLRRLQEVLVRRSDLNHEVLSKCNRVLLEVLVSIRTGLSDFLWRANDVPSSDLVEILLNLKCRNLSCRSVLPVDECDCKICSQKNGFCSTCMCLVCFKFDFAFNTCSWVGCDVCLHWCHTDCALRGSYIRNSQNDTGIKGATDTQFHCVACGHPSEMSGFVKDVFKSCAKDWTAEILAKELKYVRRIFFVSNDDHGKRIHDVACQLLSKLESMSDHPEVTDFIMEFLNGINSNSTSISSMTKIMVKNSEGCNPTLSRNNGVVPTGKDTWLPPASVDKPHHLETTSSVIPRLDCDTLSGLSGSGKLQKSLENASSVDGVDSVVKFKLAEVKMYQARADDAKREAENLKYIIHAKKEKIEEEYSNRVSKLRLMEAEERRRQKYEEFQALECSQREYLNMKLRMESDIKDLMLKMEATKCNLGT